MDYSQTLITQDSQHRPKMSKARCFGYTVYFLITFATFIMIAGSLGLLAGFVTSPKVTNAYDEFLFTMNNVNSFINKTDQIITKVMSKEKLIYNIISEVCRKYFSDIPECVSMI